MRGRATRTGRAAGARAFYSDVLPSNCSAASDSEVTVVMTQL